MYDIITFGSATWDIFLKPNGPETIKDEKKFITGKGICFNLGSKIDVDEIHFSSGGSGTNTAATFVKQGFKTAYCGRVGGDFAGGEIISELKKLGVKTSFTYKTNEKPTNTSVVLSANDEDRTIFVYRGASEIFEKKDIPWNKLKAKWFYIGPLSGKLCEIFEEIVDFAKKNNIKVAVNPGNCQLSYPPEKLKRILQKVDILLLNHEEASFLTKIPYSNESEIFKKIDQMCSGIAIMTKGPAGVVASDGKYIYSADILKVKVVDRTGAGDSFGAGFLSEFIKTNGDIESAIQFGVANSAGCLSEWGAKNGILEKNTSYEKVNVRKEECGKNNLCMPK